MIPKIRRFVRVDERWRDRAACQGMDTELFFPNIPYQHPISAGTRQRIYEAITVCAGCPVRCECYAYAKHFDHRHGIWGGRLFNRHGQPTKHGTGHVRCPA